MSQRPMIEDGIGNGGRGGYVDHDDPDHGRNASGRDRLAEHGVDELPLTSLRVFGLQ